MMKHNYLLAVLRPMNLYLAEQPWNELLWSEKPFNRSLAVHLNWKLKEQLAKDPRKIIPDARADYVKTGCSFLFSQMWKCFVK